MRIKIAAKTSIAWVSCVDMVFFLSVFLLIVYIIATQQIILKVNDQESLNILQGDLLCYHF